MTAALPAARRGGRVRGRVVVATLAVLLVAVAVVALGSGDYPVSPAGVLRVLAGGGSAGDAFVVRTLRLPRETGALLAGAALGTAGGLFQCLVRNALGSPDVLGFTAGSATGALVVLLVLAGSTGRTGGTGAVAAGAVVGGVATALAVHLLAGRGGVGGPRLVLVGVGVGAALSSVNAYLVTRAGLAQAQAATVWLTGSLADTGWGTVGPLAVAVAVLVPAAGLVARPLRALALGEVSAVGLGVRTGRTRLAVAAVGIGLTAAATAAAGPVAFVALAAPQLAVRLVRAPGPLVGTSALTGAVLLSGCDVLAARLPTGTLPVGVVTAAVGGVYLCVLLTARGSRSRP